ncbi:unnamed protein product, partial [Laminaria digitata]
RSNPLARNAASEFRRQRPARSSVTAAARMVASTASSSGKAAVGQGEGEGGAEAGVEQGSGEVGCSMEELVGLCKRRGFVFPSSEIYNGFAGFFDYGPLGVELKKNIKDAWWRDVVQARDDIVGLDSSIIGNPKVWEASGHVAGFSDPMVDCKESKLRYRADQLFYGKVL